MEEDVLDEIINITECHPYYVNVLCRRLWSNKIPPKMVDVLITWKNYVEQ